VLSAGQMLAAARLGLRPRRLIGLRALGYSRGEMAALTGESERTVDRQLVRAQRKLLDARRRAAEVG
jgi:DNA-directed RNA polymerase specialized sigma24 family protein